MTPDNVPPRIAAPHGQTQTTSAVNAEPEAPISRQKRRAALRRIDKAKAALSVPGEARNQAVLEQKRKMGQVRPPRQVRREADATLKRRT